VLQGEAEDPVAFGDASEEFLLGLARADSMAYRSVSASRRLCALTVGRASDGRPQCREGLACDSWCCLASTRAGRAQWCLA
jgi:hypothetical protein